MGIDVGPARTKPAAVGGVDRIGGRAAISGIGAIPRVQRKPCGQRAGCPCGINDGNAGSNAETRAGSPRSNRRTRLRGACPSRGDTVDRCDVASRIVDAFNTGLTEQPAPAM